MTRLFHYTCEDHGRAGIESCGGLIPNRHPWLPEPLAWLTDLDVPHREALGLTSFSLSCDRTAVRFEVDPDHVRDCHRWATYARLSLSREIREAFESAPGSLPQHWWVCPIPLPVLVPSVT